MSGYDIDRTLADWFEADALAPAPRGGLERALAGVRQHAPRPAWLAGPGSHWSSDAPRFRSSVAVPVLIVGTLLAVLLGGLILAGAPLFDAPTPTARLGALAYALDGDIFLADPDGTDPARIADGLPGGKSGCGAAGYWAEGPMWSPDGQWLTYRSAQSQVDCDRPEADTIPTVLVSDPAGNVVASVPGVGWRIPWSPDSSRFATWLDLDPSTRIGVYGPDGVRHAIVAVPPGMAPAGDYDPVWSPDGRSFLVPLSVYHEQTDHWTGASSVWELPIDGSPPREVPAGGVGSQLFSASSPDGRWVAYITSRKIFVTAAEGSEPRDLVSGVDEWAYPAWSPTGDLIAYVAGSGRLLRVVDVASGSMTTLATSSDGDQMSVIAFSPEGDRILFSRHDALWTTESLWSVGIDGSEPQRLVSGTSAGDWQGLTVGP